MRDAELRDRLAELDARLTALEAADPRRRRRRDDDAPEHDTDSGGTIGYQGDVHLNGGVHWSITLAARSVLDLPDDSAAVVLAALGHPTRAAMVCRLLTTPSTATQLQQAIGVTSTGQLYHHLRSLATAGVIEQAGRGPYRVTPTAVIPAMVLLTAAADIAGDLAQQR